MIDNLLVAGEAVGGIHGRNRLMGNSLLDIIVFGRNAGKAAAAKAKNVELGNMNLDHIQAYAEELKEAGIDTWRRFPASSSEICKTLRDKKGRKDVFD